MRRGRLLATATAAAMTVAGLTGMASAGATPQATNSGIGTASWLVLANPGASAAVIAQQLKAAGATVPR